MIAKLFFDIDGLPSDIQGQVKAKMEKERGFCTIYAPFVQLSVSKAGDLYLLVEDPTPEIIKLVLERNGLTLSRLELSEEAYLDEKSVRPSHGTYDIGKSQARVDSFMHQVDVFEPGNRVCKIIVRSHNVQSAFDLYEGIRSGKTQANVSSYDMPELPSSSK